MVALLNRIKSLRHDNNSIQRTQIKSFTHARYSMYVSDKWNVQLCTKFIDQPGFAWMKMILWFFEKKKNADWFQSRSQIIAIIDWNNYCCECLRMEYRWSCTACVCLSVCHSITFFLPLSMPQLDDNIMLLNLLRARVESDAIM